MKSYLLLIVAALAAACSTKPVPGVCCIGAEDCSQLGLSKDRPCPAGQACVEFQCAVPTCSIQGCPAEAPVCDVTVDVCTGCTDSADCSRFPGTGVCDVQTGSCVECLAQADCTAPTEPICDGGSCRGCRRDTECPSGACGDDGACVPEASLVYLHPAGQDVAPCTRSAPCVDLAFGIRQTTEMRNHVVINPGLYTASAIRISPTNTSARSVFIHGHGAKIINSVSELMFGVSVPTVIRDLQVEAPMSQAFLVNQAVLERVRIYSSLGLRAEGSVTMKDVVIEVTPGGIAVDNEGILTIDRGILSGGAIGIQGAGLVDITNLLVYGTSDTALQLANGRGSVSFTTVAESGSASSIAGGIKCPSIPDILTVRSSIFWTPGLRPAAAGECRFLSSMAGPIGVIGASNLDPMFMDAMNRNYRLSAGSPARDAVDSGPAVDFEGDPRPRGARFDLGADEAP